MTFTSHQLACTKIVVIPMPSDRYPLVGLEAETLGLCEGVTRSGVTPCGGVARFQMAQTA